MLAPPAIQQAPAVPERPIVELIKLKSNSGSQYQVTVRTPVRAIKFLEVGIEVQTLHGWEPYQRDYAPLILKFPEVKASSATSLNVYLDSGHEFRAVLSKVEYAPTPGEIAAQNARDLAELNARLNAEYELVQKERAARDQQIKKQPAWARKLIQAKKIKPGMTTLQVMLAWGDPDDTHKIISESGVDQSWSYGDTRLFFVNNKLKTIAY